MLPCTAGSGERHVRNQRLLRREPGGATTLYLDGQELQLSAGTVSGTRYYAHGAATVAVRKQSGGSNTLSWLASDHQGSFSLAVNSSTGAVSKQRYLPFGAQRGTPNQSFRGRNRAFLGQTDDDSTGLVYLNARYYDASLARFVSGDPVLAVYVPQGINPYQYASNDPLLWSDPTGLKQTLEGGEGGGAGTGGAIGFGGVTLTLWLWLYGTDHSADTQQLVDEFSAVVGGIVDTVAQAADASTDEPPPPPAVTGPGPEELDAEEIPAPDDVIPEWLQHEKNAGNALGREQNTKDVEVNGRIRRPDFLKRDPDRPGKLSFIGDAKRVLRLAMTLQLRDYLALAEDSGIALVLVLQRGYTQWISDEILELEKLGKIVLQYIE